MLTAISVILLVCTLLYMHCYAKKEKEPWYYHSSPTSLPTPQFSSKIQIQPTYAPRRIISGYPLTRWRAPRVSDDD